MIITTERLTLRRVEAGDWESIKRIWDDQSRSDYAQYDKPCRTEPDSVRKTVERWASAAESREHMFFAACLDGALIGYVAFNIRENGYETGYCFHSDYHGKGYAKESISALIAHVCSLQPCAVITAGTALENVPSVKLLRSLGFRRTGTEPVSFHKDAAGRDIFFEGGIFELDTQETMNP